MRTKYSLLFCFLFCLLNSVQAQVDSNMTLLGRWDNDNLPASFGIAFNDIWGWADTSQGREYAIMGSLEYTYFIEVTDPANPVVRDSVAGGYHNCIHRDFKTYQNYCYAVADEGNTQSTLQIMDMSYLPDSVHVVFDSDTFFNRSHNIFIDEPGGRLYAVGNYPSNKRCVVLDLASNPANPPLLSNVNLGIYAHDIYVENDTAYLSCGGNGLYVYDYTNATSPSLMGVLSTYPQKGYTHACWRTEDGSHLILADETHNTSVKMVDITDLSNMNVVSLFRSTLLAPADTASIPHNPFMAGDYAVISYYHDGLQIYDVSNPNAPFRKAWYDTDTVSTSYSGFKGCWGAYPYLPSGTILASDIAGGLYTFRMNFPFPYALESQLTAVQVDCHGAANGSLTASVSGGTPPYSFLWSNGDTLEMASGLGPGMYTVLISDRYGNQIQDSAQISEPTALQATTTIQNENCSGASDGSLDLSASGGTGAISYLWSTGDTTEDLNNLGPGTYICTLTDANGCTLTDTNTVISTTVQPIADAGADLDICQLPAALDALPANVGTGTWTQLSGGGTILNSSDPKSALSGLSVGNYVYQWAITNGACAAEDTVELNVYGTIGTDAGPDQFVCGDSTNLSAGLPPQGGGTWSVWVGSGNFANPNSISSAVTGLSPGLNHLIWEVVDGPCTVQDTVIIDAGSFPAAAFGYQISGALVTFSDSSSYANTWSWDFGDGASGITTNPTHTYAGGTWTACLTITNDCGSDSSCVSFFIDIPNGLESASGNSWSIGPVPAREVLHIRGDFSANAEILLFDLQGKEIRHWEVNATGSPRHKLNLNGISEGIYLLKISPQDSESLFFKLPIRQ